MSDVTPEERFARLETEVSALKQSIMAQFAALNLRLDEVIISQVKDHGKRIQALEKRGTWSAGWIAGAGAVTGALIVLAANALKYLSSQ